MVLLIVAVIGGIAAWGYYQDQHQEDRSSYNDEPSPSYTPRYQTSPSYEESSGSPSPTTIAPSSPGPDLSALPPKASPTAFTLGSTRAEVEAAQGTPSSIDKTYGETWSYETASVEFREGKVFAWHSSPFKKLNVELVPRDSAKASEARARGSFTLGSTKDEVLAVQGTPDSLDRTYGETWSYGTSTIEFTDGKVRGWHGSPVGARLKAHLEPRRTAAAEAAATRGFYGPSATKDEILAVEGTPTSIDNTFGETWSYGTSTISFTNGRISEYHDSPVGPQLRIRTVATTTTATPGAEKATVEGFTQAFMAALDKVAEDLCSCSTVACARQIAASARDRGFKAGYAYTDGKEITPELRTFFATMLGASGDAFSAYLKTNYSAWWSRSTTRIDGCIAALKARESVP